MAGNHYQALGVHPAASPDAIRRAWRIAAARNHPDRHSSDGRADEYTERMVNLNEAYQTLSDAERRRRYDIEQGLIPARCSVCGQTGSLRHGPGGQTVAVCEACWKPVVTAVEV